MSNLVYNAIKCPDGTVLVSKNRHDYKTHVDATNQQTYMVDGGLNYLRRNVTDIPAEELSVDDSMPFEIVRMFFEWGSYGRNGDMDLHYLKLKDMTTGHIKAVLAECKYLPEWRVALMERELAYREEGV